jgi:ribosomal protein S27AE
VDLTCPACTAPDLIADRQGNFDCNHCGTHLLTERTECPACGELNNQGADLCSNCSEPLSIVASVIDRQGTTGRPLWIRRLRTQVAELKQSEARASADRFEHLVDIDRRRKSAEAEAHASQERKDRNILFYGVAAALVIVIILMLLAAIL